MTSTNSNITKLFCEGVYKQRLLHLYIKYIKSEQVLFLSSALLQAKERIKRY